MLDILSVDISISTIFALLLLMIPLFFVYYLGIQPWRLVKFYRNKGFITQFKPIISTFDLQDQSVALRSEYYARMIDMCQLKQRPLGLVRNVGSTCMIMLYDAEMIREVFINKDSFIKHAFQNAIMRHLSPYGLVLLEGDWWKKHRRVISKGFDYDRIDTIIPHIIDCAQRRVGMLGERTVIKSMINFFKESAGQIIGEVYFDYDLNQKKIDGVPLTIYLSDTIAQLAKLSYTPVYCATNLSFIKLGIFSQHRAAMKRVELLRNAVRQIVRYSMNKLSQTPPEDQKFNMWRIFSDRNQNNTFNQEQMIDEFITFFSDGVYTTGLFMTMFTYYMVKNPEWKQKLREQLKVNILESKQPVTQKIIQNLPVLQGCIKETLRLAPPVVTGIQRIATKDHTFSNGVMVKKDTMVMACHLVNHIDPMYHDNPLVFDPSRWEQNTKTTTMYKQYPGSYMPFSIGERNCPGQKFAQVESSILFAHLFNLFDTELEDKSHQIKFTQRFLREPLEPISCVFTRK